MALKIFTVTFNDGDWHQSLPKFTVVAESADDAEEMVRNEQTAYKNCNGWASEFKIEGYEISVKNAKAQQRDDQIDAILNEKVAKPKKKTKKIAK